MLSRLSLRLKLILSFLVIAAVLAGVSFYQIRTIQHFDDLFLNLEDKDATRLEALNDLGLLNVKVRGATYEYQHEVLEGNLLRQKAATIDLARYSKELISAQKRYQTLVSEDRAYVTSADLQAVATATNEVITRSLAVVHETNSSQSYTAPEVEEGGLIAAQEKLDNTLEAAMIAERRGVESENKEIVTLVQDLQNTVAWLAFGTIAIAIVLGLLLASWISRAVLRLRLGAARIANGDFSTPISITSQDEIGQLGIEFNRMSVRLRDTYQRIAALQERDEAMLKGMSEGLIAIDAKGAVVMINPVAVDLLGLPDEAAAQGKLLSELYKLYDPVTDKMVPSKKRPSYISLMAGEEVRDIYGFHTASGKRLLSISSSPVKPDEAIVGAITLLRDVTKEREIDRMKTEFISLASHQLRTPLSAIKWFTEMLVSGDAGKLQPEQLDFANNIADSTERMIALVNALLNISRIESGRIMIEPQPTDLRELVGGIVNDLKAKTEERQQTLIISVHEKLPKINLDPRLISQVYLNLLTNAVKYTPKGGEISVFISKKDDQIISQVTDSGYGIPKDQQDRVFQKFFRASNAVKVETDGTGLGLYLIKAVVESSGGKIWFESEEGRGSTFWFSIPVSGMKPKAGEVTLDA
jgi:signal transduction histidine kinase